MTVVVQDKTILLIFLCFSVWLAVGMLGVTIPILNFFVTGTARTISIDKRSNIIMKGSKAGQFVIFQFLFYIGFIFSLFSFWSSYRYWWIGIVLTLISIPYMIHATFKADRIPRKNMFFDIKDIWHPRE